MTRDPAHLDALRLRLSHERARLAAAIAPSEVKLRTVWVEQIEREIAAELVRWGAAEAASADFDMSDDELLRELGY